MPDKGITVIFKDKKSRDKFWSEVFGTLEKVIKALPSEEEIQERIKRALETE